MIKKLLLTGFMLLLLFCTPVFNCVANPVIPKDNGLDKEYNEILVSVSISEIGQIELPAIIQNDSVYLSVTDLFEFLKIRSVVSTGFDSISVFFYAPDEKFIIDKTHNSIQTEEELLALNPGDMIQNGNNFYLRLECFNKVFGIDCRFNFRSLSINVQSNREIPAVNIIRQEQMRESISLLDN